MFRTTASIALLGALCARAAVAAPAPRALAFPAPTAALSAGIRADLARPGASAPEARFLNLVNAERMRRGLPTVAWDPTLCSAARQHSEEMARLGYFDHSSPVAGLESPADRWEQCVADPPPSYTIAENLFYGSVPDVSWGHRSLMHSEAHRENILNPEFTRAGIGVYVAGDGEMWVTEMFVG
ncbi:MAG TPA: CAP domain-containing protein [Armatimonadota bacterium]|jgi:uncharacterized protein YkwD